MLKASHQKKMYRKSLRILLIKKIDADQYGFVARLRSRKLFSLLLRQITLVGAFSFIGIKYSSMTFAQEPTIAPPLQKKPQRTLDLNKKLALGILNLPKDRSALAFNLGLSSNSFLEIAFGGDWRQPTSRASEIQLDLALGAHLQLIQAGDIASFTLGTRVQLSYSEICRAEDNLCAERSVVSNPTPQYRFVIPFRIYYFPAPYLSLHSEIGVEATWGEAGASESGLYLSGQTISVFSQSHGYGRLGLSLWF